MTYYLIPKTNQTVYKHLECVEKDIEYDASDIVFFVALFI